MALVGGTLAIFKKKKNNDVKNATNSAEKKESESINTKNLEKISLIATIGGSITTTLFYTADNIIYQINDINYKVALDSKAITTFILTTIFTFIHLLIYLNFKNIKDKTSNIKNKYLNLFIAFTFLIINYPIFITIFELNIKEIFNIYPYILYTFIIYIIIITIFKQKEINLLEELFYIQISLIISLILSKFLIHSVNYYNNFYFTNYKNKEMIIFKQEDDKAILCDFETYNNNGNIKYKYNCKNNNIIVNITGLKLYKKE